jgi:hypothetical protein
VIVDPEMVLAPERVPNKVEAVTVFEPVRVPYKVVPEMLPVVIMLFAPLTEP